MATEEISCEEKLVKTKLRLNLKDIDKHYSSDGTLKFVKCLPSPILGSQSLALLVHYVQSTKYITLRSVHGVKNLKFQVDLEVLLTDSSRIKIVESFMDCDDHLQCIHKIRNTEARIQTITGIVTLTFEPEDGVALKDELIYKFGESVLEIEKAGKEAKPEKPMEIKIECQGEKIEFHKSLLAKISDVFQNMVENPNFIESHNGVITMKEVSPNTVKAFKKLLYDDGNLIEATDLDVELMLFCDRYNIKPMVDLCSQHLQNQITKENLMEIVDAAFKINDDDLLKKAVDFVRLNYGSFEEIEEWKDFIKSNPKCVAKMMEFIMFK